MEVHGLKDLREGAGDVVGAAGEDAFSARHGDELDADAVPFPLGAELRRVECCEVGGFEGLREHGRAEDGGTGRVGAVRFAREPGEEGTVGRDEAVPDFLDVVGLDAPAGQLREGDLGEPGGGADAERARDELEQGVAGGSVGRVEPAGEDGGKLGFGRGEERLDDLGEARGGLVGGPGGPDEGDGLGEVAYVVVRPGEEHGVGALLGESADEGGLGGVEGQLLCEGREAEAAVGVGLGLEVAAHERDLGEASWREGQALQEVGEGDQVRASSSSSP